MKCKKNILKKQKKLLDELKEIGPFIIGSTSVVKRVCGKPYCICKKDPEKRHPSMLLGWKENKKTKSIYVPVSMHADVKLWSDNYKKLKSLIIEISDLQRDIVKYRLK
ncbi:MAG: DUF6788 family protein [Pseudomonadota bacterium]